MYDEVANDYSLICQNFSTTLNYLCRQIEECALYIMLHVDSLFVGL